LDESLEIVSTLLRGEPVDRRHGLLPTRSPGLEPAPANPPPVVVGGRSEAGLRRAARCADGWLGVWLSAGRVAAARERLTGYAREYGRPRCTVALMIFVLVTDDPASGRGEAAEFVRGQYGLSFDRLERWVVIGNEAAVADRLRELRAAGAEAFVLVPAARDPLAQYRRLAAVRVLLDR
jgi:alkanesulfonate monooxygenase SsuD/methylene tetrahydromethanopterin reductase-like flavin-dependent oxidoreductase (luciferase family)